QTQTGDGYVRVLRILAPDPFIEDELSQPARTVLCDLVNFNLAGKVSPRLLAESSPVRGSNLPVLASLQLAPATLAACLWLQLAQVVSGAKTQRQCAGCGKWFESQERRSDKLYCGDACRKQLHQERRLRACRLHAEGKRIKEISQEVGADVAQVKKWVANAKG